MFWPVVTNFNIRQTWVKDNSEWWEALLSVLPTLAYGDICQESWQDLKTSDCIHFIQLAQCALAYMLYEADAADTKLVRACMPRGERLHWAHQSTLFLRHAF